MLCQSSPTTHSLGLAPSAPGRVQTVRISASCAGLVSWCSSTITAAHGRAGSRSAAAMAHSTVASWSGRPSSASRAR